MRHAIWMLIGCVGAFLLIFLLPVLGVSSGVTLLIFLFAMFACHLLMIFGHRHGDEQTGNEKGHHHG